MRTYGNDNKSALEAKTEATKIAFMPIMFQAAKGLRDFGILQYLRKNKDGKSVTEIAENCNISQYGALVLLEAGLSLEMIKVDADKYFITKTGYFVLVDQMTRANMDFTHDVNYLGFYHLDEAIKTGKPAGLKNVFDKPNTVYEALAEMSPKFRESWFGFDHFYSDDSFPAALPIVFKNNPKRIMDVGGNTGKFSIKCAQYSDSVKVTILDLPGQLRDAKKNIEEHGFQDRIDGFPINLLDFSKPYPTGYDVIWMSQFLDCFSEQEILGLMTNARNAMDENAELLIMETFWDLQRFEASTYSLHATSLYFTCIANGNSRMYHSEDMIKLADMAGLEVTEIIENVGISHTILRCRKKM